MFQNKRIEELSKWRNTDSKCHRRPNGVKMYDLKKIYILLNYQYLTNYQRIMTLPIYIYIYTYIYIPL